MLQPDDRERVQQECHAAEECRSDRDGDGSQKHIHPETTNEQSRGDIDGEAAGERQQVSDEAERREDGALKGSKEGQSATERGAPEGKLTAQDGASRVQQEREEDGRYVAQQRVSNPPSRRSIRLPWRHPEQEVGLAEDVAVQQAVTKENREHGRRDDTEQRRTCTPMLKERGDRGRATLLHEVGSIPHAVVRAAGRETAPGLSGSSASPRRSRTTRLDRFPETAAAFRILAATPSRTCCS